MGGCPIHIWAPLMAALVPVARVVRDRFNLFSRRRPEAPVEPARALHRFAPIAPAGASAQRSSADAGE
jgi:hypothetical protein